ARLAVAPEPESRDARGALGTRVVGLRRQPAPTLFPYTTLFRSAHDRAPKFRARDRHRHCDAARSPPRRRAVAARLARADDLRPRSEEHTSELQSRSDLVCRLLLEKKEADAVTRARA